MNLPQVAFEFLLGDGCRDDVVEFVVRIELQRLRTNEEVGLVFYPIINDDGDDLRTISSGTPLFILVNTSTLV